MYSRFRPSGIPNIAMHTLTNNICVLKRKKVYSKEGHMDFTLKYTYGFYFTSCSVIWLSLFLYFVIKEEPFYNQSLQLQVCTCEKLPLQCFDNMSFD